MMELLFSFHKAMVNEYMSFWPYWIVFNYVIMWLLCDYAFQHKVPAYSPKDIKRIFSILFLNVHFGVRPLHNFWKELKLRYFQRAFLIL